MPPSNRRWTEVAPSPFPWEREALHFLRERLPDHEPWRAWTNFQFIAHDGSLNEVDALILGRMGLFLVEIKGHRGTATGDQGTLTFQREGGDRTSIDHPLRLADLKAKRLKSLLLRSKPFQKEPLPFIEPLVFLSHAEELRLDPPANTALCLRDRDGTGGVPARDGIIAALIHRHAPGLRAEPSTFPNKPIAKALTKAMGEIGIAPIPSKRRVKDYEIIETLEETEVSRDELGRHVQVRSTLRRIRRYFVPRDLELGSEQVERAARREFQLLERLDHPGVLRAKEYTTDEQGPVLLFEHIQGSQRLDRYLDEHGDKLSLDDRLDLVRQVAEAVRYAHGRQVVHRCLSPQSVLVLADETGLPSTVKIKVMNWSTGARGAERAESTSVVTATSHPEAYQEPASAVYLAPELRRDPSSTEPSLDVFSLGALTYRLISGRAPASSTDELFERVRDGGLRLSGSTEGTSPALDRLVAEATDANVSRRLATVDDFLKRLDEVSSEDSTEEVCRTPPEAIPGQRLENGLIVRRRLGAGSTAVAFLVERVKEAGDTSEHFVFKVPRHPDQSERLVREAAVLQQLEHPNVTRFAELVELGPYRGFLTRPANEETLRQRLRSEGPLQLELLERFGEQLLDALVHLEERGINHRDIKPDNIAVTDFGRNQALGLVLFDFSLSGAPLDDLRAGTVAYADPFLGERGRSRWDLHAERYSAALTLYEMATLSLPEWGDAKSDPRVTEAERITLAPEQLPAGLRDELVDFFLRAFARQTAARFDNAAAMRDAWRKVFRGTRHSPVLEAPEDAAATLDERTRALGVRTPLHELPFSTRASNALDRLSLFTVEDLLRTPPFQLASARGVGAKTRSELDQITRALRRKYPDVEIAAEPVPTPPDDDAPAAPDALASKTVEELLALLRPDGRRRKEHRDAFEALYGNPAALQIPTQTEAARALGATPQQLQGWLESLRSRWNASGTARALVADLAAVLDRHQGVLSFREASEALIGQRGSAREGDSALASAAALVRIATDVESLADSPRWRLRRRDGNVWLARDDDLVRYAEQLGSRALALSRREPIPTREAVEAGLSSVQRPVGVEAFPPGRLARLAVAAAPDQVDLSGRGELYPIGLDPERALKLSVGALAGAGEALREGPDRTDTGRRLVPVEEVHARVRARYPRVASLPERPELDALLRAAGWEFEWSDEHAAYSTRVDDSLTLAPSSTRWHRSRDAMRVVTPDDGFDQRVRNAIQTRSFRVLKVHPDDLEPAQAALEARFPELEQVDLDVEIASALRAFLAERGIRSDTLFEADAGGPMGRGWGNVMRVMETVLERVEEDALVVGLDAGRRSQPSRLDQVRKRHVVPNRRPFSFHLDVRGLRASLLGFWAATGACVL